MPQTTLSDVEIFLDEETRAGLMKVIDGRQESFEMKIALSPERISQILKEFGLDKIRGTLESNGWEWDFWQDYEKGDSCVGLGSAKLFVLSGSGWYGGIQFAVKNV